jgi:class 3 adenylate cyclase
MRCPAENCGQVLPKIPSTIGFEGRFDYAAIGVASKFASRLCDEVTSGQILISLHVLITVEDAIRVEAAGEFALKASAVPWRAAKSANLTAVLRSFPPNGSKRGWHDGKLAMGNS